LLHAVARPPIRDLIVVDNASRDATARFAKQCGARVIDESRVGYGYACLAGVAALRDDCDVVLFLPVEGSDAVVAHAGHAEGGITDGGADCDERSDSI
jgi:glycosyltransferase involved in cell wall biosynthesis